MSDPLPFADLWPEAVAALEQAGIHTPTPVQQQAIPAIRTGADVVAHSGTGTGKTLAYLLPVLQSLRDTPGQRAAVFTPGAELAMQTLGIARSLMPDLQSAAAITATNRRRQKKRVLKSTRLVVGTTDRLVELFREGKLKGVTLMVFDELDPILASREAPFLDSLLSRSEPQVQKIVVSATLGRRADAFLQRFLPTAVRVTPQEAPFVDRIEHAYVRVRGAKEVALARFIDAQRCKPAIVFVSDPGQQQHLFHYLRQHGHRPASVGRDRSKRQRQQAIVAFREGDARLLLTSDAIARGLDFPAVPWVLHYDVPRSPEAYVHRAGRTGRAGREGRSVLFVESSALGALRRLERGLELSIPAF